MKDLKTSSVRDRYEATYADWVYSQVLHMVRVFCDPSFMNELYQALTLLIKVVLLILSLLILPLSAPILAGISRYRHRQRYRNEIERAARPRRR